MLKNIYILTASLVFSVAFPAIAETIVLKNKTMITGKVIGQNKNSITIRLENGKTRIIRKKLISKITYKSVAAVKQELANEEKKAAEKLIEKNKIKEKQPEKNKPDVAASDTKAINQVKETTPSELPPTVMPKTDEIIIETPPEISRNRALVYSALLPGLGQYKQQRKISLLWTGSFLAAAGAVARLSTDYQKEDKFYRQSANFFFLYPLYLTTQGQYTAVSTDSLYIYSKYRLIHDRERERRAAKNLNNAIGIASGLYLLNLVDVFVFHPTAVQTLAFGIQSQDFDDLGGRFSWTWYF